MWLSWVPRCAVGHAGISHLFAPPSSACRVNDRVQGGIQPYSGLTKKKGKGNQERIGVKVKVKVAQSCLTLCDPMDYTVHGILQAGILEWVAFPFSRGSSQARNGTQVSRIAGGLFTS